MSCPYFDPIAPQVPGSGPESAMLPLGDMWAGLCRAARDAPWQPDHATLQPYCNLGYARGACAHFPDDDGPDAVRFTVYADDGAVIRLYHVLERDHHPFAHGPLEYPLAAAPAADSLLARQAHAYVQSYLRRKQSTLGVECGYGIPGPSPASE